MSAGPTGPTPGGSETLTLRELVRRILRHKKLVAGVTLGVVTIVALWVFLYAPRYRSTALLRIMERSSDVQMLEDLSELPGLELAELGRDNLETEIGVLRSWRINQAVVDSLNLAVRMTQPKGIRSSVFRVVERGDPDMRVGVVLERGSDGAYTGTAERPNGDGAVREIGPVRPGETFRVYGYVLELVAGDSREAADDGDTAPAGDESPPGSIEIEIVPRFAAVRALQDNVRIERQESGSRLVEVSYTIPDRELAAAVVNSVVREYVDYRTSAEKIEVRSTAEELRRQVELFDQRLADTEEELRRYQEQERVVVPEEQAIAQVERIAELQVERDALAVERDALRKMVQVIEDRAAGEAGTRSYRQLATFPSLIESDAVSNLLNTLVELEDQRDRLMVLRNEEHPDVQVLTRRIEAVENQLHSVGSDYLESLDEQVAAGNETLEQLQAELEQLPERAMRYARLVRDRELQSETYIQLQQQLKQAEVQEAVQSDRVRVVDAGFVSHPDDPAYPMPLLSLVLAVIMGLAAGFAAALIRDLWDNRVRSGPDARLAAAGLPVVAELPPLPRKGRVSRLLPWNGDRPVPAKDGRRGRRAARGLAQERDLWGPAAEAYRSLATSLALTGSGVERTLVVTSPRPRDGKSTVAANLAGTFAQLGLRTLLIDADLRKGRLHERVGGRGRPGLFQVLTGAASLESAVQEIELAHSDEPLHLLASGGPPDRPLDLARSERLVEVLGRARSGWDRIVIDTPPLESSADATVLCSRGGNAVLVARRDRTDRDALERAAERLREVAERVHGLVLNDSDRALETYSR